MAPQAICMHHIQLMEIQTICMYYHHFMYSKALGLHDKLLIDRNFTMWYYVIKVIYRYYVLNSAWHYIMASDQLDHANTST